MTYNRTAKEECLLGSDKLKAFDTLHISQKVEKIEYMFDMKVIEC